VQEVENGKYSDFSQRVQISKYYIHPVTVTA